MNRRLRVAALALLSVVLLCTLAGCRRRIVDQEGMAGTDRQIEGGNGAGASLASSEAGERGDFSRVDPDLPPEAEIEAEIEPIAADEIGEEDLNSGAGENARQGEPAENRVWVEENSDAGGETKPSDAGGVVETIMDEYAELLEQGLGTLYECQVAYVYLEVEEDYWTVNRHDAAHQLILDAGGYNAAEKRGDDRLRIDDEWILRKNPSLIIKIVEKDILGAGVEDTTLARGEIFDLLARPGWSGVSAVMNRNVLVLSRALMETPEGRFAAKLYISKAMYPALFQDMDVDAICARMLTAQYGPKAGGIYALSAHAAGRESAI